MKRSKAITHLLYDTFSEEMKRIEGGLCPFCGEPVEREGLRDKVSKLEFDISGLCQKCQDKEFG